MQMGDKESAHEHTGSAESIRPSLRSGFTAYNVISPVRRALLPPSSAEVASRELDASFGRQDHTTSPYASATLVSRGISVHRIPPRVRDDRDPPLSSGETGGVMRLIWPAC